MAKKSVVNRNKKRQRMASLQDERRKKYRNDSLDMSLSDEDRQAAFTKLQKLSRNGAKCRVNSRCALTGRGRAVYKKFGLSRIKFRELALEGKIPGVTKASW